MTLNGTMKKLEYAGDIMKQIQNLEEIMKGEAHLKLIGIYLRDRFKGSVLNAVRFYFSSPHFHSFDKYFYTHREIPPEERVKRYYERYGRNES